MDEITVTKTEASKLAGVSHNTISAWVRDEKVDAHMGAYGNRPVTRIVLSSLRKVIYDLCAASIVRTTELKYHLDSIDEKMAL